MRVADQPLQIPLERRPGEGAVQSVGRVVDPPDAGRDRDQRAGGGDEPVAAEAGVVHPHVDVAEVVERGAQQGLHVVLARHVAPQGDGALAELLAERVGGLGLGYTARAVLEDTRVGSLLVVDALEAVIEWHGSGLLPLGPELTGDPRCRFVHGDFFVMSAAAAGFDPERPGRRFDAILVDIDHSPDALLAPGSAGFYQPDGLRGVAAHLRPGGVFGLWSNEPPDDAFTARLAAVFAEARGEPVVFHNPLQNRDFTQTVYLART